MYGECSRAKKKIHYITPLCALLIWFLSLFEPKSLQILRHRLQDRYECHKVSFHFCKNKKLKAKTKISLCTIIFTVVVVGCLALGQHDQGWPVIKETPVLTIKSFVRHNVSWTTLYNVIFPLKMVVWDLTAISSRSKVVFIDFFLSL